MVSYPVFLVSFRAVSEPIVVRFVLVPGEEVKNEIEKIEVLLDRVYHFGQNEVQPQTRRSVSVGDVIVAGDVPYLVLNVGFRRLGSAEFELYKKLDRDSRFRIYRV